MNDYYWHLVAVTSERYERAARQARQAEQSFAVARGRASNLLGAMSVVLTAVIAVSMLDPGSVVIRAALAAIQCTLLVMYLRAGQHRSVVSDWAIEATRELDEATADHELAVQNAAMLDGSHSYPPVLASGLPAS